MNTPNDGGPAFPRPASEYEPNGIRQDGRISTVPYKGMSLRDYFAAKAMQGIVSAAVFDQRAEDMMKKAGIDVKKDTEAFVAMLAYNFADAMLKAREESK